MSTEKIDGSNPITRAMAITVNADAEGSPRAPAKDREPQETVVEILLGECRTTASALMAADDSKFAALAKAADAAIEAMEDCIDVVATKKAAQAREVETAIKAYPDSPGVDPTSLATVRAQAGKNAGLAFSEKARPELDAAVTGAASGCSELALMTDLASATTNPDLEDALDGKISATEKASTEFLADYLAGLPMARVSQLYRLLRDGDGTTDRLVRFERAALAAADGRTSMTTAELIKITTAAGGSMIGRDVAKRREPEGADRLRKEISDARAERTPPSVAIARTLVEQLARAFKALCQTDASMTALGIGWKAAINETSQEKPWRPMSGWQARYGFAGK